MNGLKKNAAVLVILAICVLLAGCSNAELAFYNMSAASGNLALGPTEQSGEIHFTMAGLENTIGSLGLDSLKYTVKADPAKDIMECVLFCKNGVSADYTELAQIIMANNALYIKLDKLGERLSAAGNPSVKAFLDKGVRDAEYLVITPESYLKALGVKETGTNYVNFTSLFSLSRQNQTNQLMMKYMEGLLQKVYADYTTGLIKQDGGKYVLSLNFSQLAPFLKELSFYTLDNFDKFSFYTGSFIENMTDEELALLNLNASTKKDANNALALASLMVKSNREQYKKDVAEVWDEMQVELDKVLAGSSFTSSIEKVNNTEYKSDFTLYLQTSGNGKPLPVTFQGAQSIKASQAFSLTAPTGKMLTLEELQARISRVLKINIDSGSWELKEDQSSLRGKCAVKIIDNYTYLSFRQVAEALGEEVGWDPAISKAYVTGGGKRVYMTGVIMKGTLYAKTRDFARIGYKVDWDAKNRIVTLTKSLF